MFKINSETTERTKWNIPLFGMKSHVYCHLSNISTHFPYTKVSLNNSFSHWKGKLVSSHTNIQLIYMLATHICLKIFVWKSGIQRPSVLQAHLPIFAFIQLSRYICYIAYTWKEYARGEKYHSIFYTIL